MGLDNCNVCKGLGILPPQRIKCPSCGGTGKRPTYPDIHAEPPARAYTEAQIHMAWMKAKSPMSLQSLLVALRNLSE